MNRSSHWVFVGILVVLAVFHGLTLLDYPAPQCDEAFYGMTAMQYTAALGNSTHWPGESLFFLPHGRTYWVFLGTALHLFGTSLFVARFVSLIGTLALVAATYFVGYQYSSRRTALWAAALTGFAWVLMFAGRLARPDVMAAAMITFGIGLIPLTLNSQRRSLYILLGFITLFATDLHLNAIHFMAPITLVVLWQLYKTEQLSYLLWFGLGLTGSAIWVGYLHLADILPAVIQVLLTDPAGFASGYLNLNANTNNEMNILVASATSFGRFWWNFYGWLTPYLSVPQAALFLLGLGVALVKGQERTRWLAITVLISSATFAIINRNYTLLGYSLLWLPLYMVMGVAAVTVIVNLNPEWPASIRKLDTLVFIGLLALFIGGSLYLTRWRYGTTYQHEANQMLEYIPAGSRVMTSTYWWYGLTPQVTLIDDHNTRNYDSIAKPQDTQALLADPQNRSIDPLVQQAFLGLTHIQPDYVISDGHIGCAPGELSIASDAYYDATCTAIARIESGLFGTQIVYDCTGS